MHLYPLEQIINGLLEANYMPENVLGNNRRLTFKETMLPEQGIELNISSL